MLTSQTTVSAPQHERASPPAAQTHAPPPPQPQPQSPPSPPSRSTIFTLIATARDEETWLAGWQQRQHRQGKWSREVMYRVSAGPTSPVNATVKKQFMQQSRRSSDRGDDELLVVPIGLTAGMCPHELAVGRYLASPPRSPTAQHTHHRRHHHGEKSTSSSSGSVDGPWRQQQQQHGRPGSVPVSERIELCSCSDVSCSLGASSERSASEVFSPVRSRKKSDATAFALHS